MRSQKDSDEKEDEILSQLIETFEKRGLKVEQKHLALQKLKYINYYKLKELAYTFSISPISEEPQYKDITFDELIARYYQDKKLRMELMDFIEMIETAFKARFSYHMGREYGPIGFYKFNMWTNKEKFEKWQIECVYKRFLESLDNNVYLGDLNSLKEIFQRKGTKKIDINSIPIWNYIEVTTFGEVLKLFEIMSTKVRNRIALDFNCSADELESWLGNLKLVRNKIAHNSVLIDVKFKTKPILKDEWKKYLLLDKYGNSSGGLAESILIIIFLTTQINKKQYFNNMQKAINHIINKNLKNAQRLGFSDINHASNCIKKLGGNFHNPYKEVQKRKKKY